MAAMKAASKQGGSVMKQVSIAPLAASRKTEKLADAAYQALYAVIGLFIKNMHGSLMQDLFNHALVENACEQIRAERPLSERDNKITLTEIGLKTGLDTRLIRRLREETLTVNEHNISAEAAILSRWERDPGLRDDDSGQPKDLVIYGKDGTFQSLVLSVAGRGISATAVLERFVKRGNVKRVGKQRVRLANSIWRFIEEGEDDMLRIAASSIVSLSNTIKHNLNQLGQSHLKRLERRVFSSAIPADKRDEVERLVNQKLLEYRQELLELMEPFESQRAAEASEVLGVGFYFLREYESKLHHKYFVSSSSKGDDSSE